MKILLVSYGDFDYDGRLRGLMNIFSRLGDMYSICRGKEKSTQNHLYCNCSYFNFISKAISFAQKMESIDILVLDNRKATIPGFIIRSKLHPRTVILDCRELYLFKEQKRIFSKIGCIFEKRMARKADIVICANKERAELMQKNYRLLRKPLVYENLRKLRFENDNELCEAKAKIDPYLEDGEVRIISSSGCSIQRTNDILVKNLHNVKYKCKLFLVGESTQKDTQIIKGIAEENVVILGRLNQTELKYLISRCHIGVVNYGQYDTNNKYCASGKIYEFLYEGIPVVTTTNPPLKRICEDGGIGESDNEYHNGINRIIENYEFYKNSVARFIKCHTIEDNDERIIKDITTVIGM